MIEPRACPFCAGIGVVTATVQGDWIECICAHCSASGPMVRKMAQVPGMVAVLDQDNAIKAWNERKNGWVK
jgi:hypothetical protein